MGCPGRTTVWQRSLQGWAGQSELETGPTRRHCSCRIGVRIANEILMYLRKTRKLAGEVSLSETLDTDGDGSNLSILDLIRVDDDMLEELDTRDACRKVRICVERVLDERERKVIVGRYGLDGNPPRTQREIAAQCGISRSYISRIEKKALKKLEEAMERPDGLSTGK